MNILGFSFSHRLNNARLIVSVTAIFFCGYTVREVKNALVYQVYVIPVDKFWNVSGLSDNITPYVIPLPEM